MPYEHYAQNPQTGEYVGWNGTDWVAVHPREVPGTVANDAAIRQPQMQSSARRAQREANPTFLDKVSSVIGGGLDTTWTAGNEMGRQFSEYQRENPLKTLVLPGGPTLPVLTHGMVEGVKARGTDMGEAIGDKNYLRAVGDAVAIATAPVGGTMFADIADEIKNDPYRALGQAGGVAATFAAPKAVQTGMKRTGPIGRSMQRSAAKRGSLAVGARKLPEIESLYKVDDAGKPSGAIVDLLDSPEGLPVAGSKQGLRTKLIARDKTAGAAVGETKAAVQPGQYILNPEQVQSTILKSIDDQVGRRTNTVGGKPTTRPDGRPLGATTTDTTAIDNLEAAKQDILASAPNGTLDLVDLFNKLDTWDQVYETTKAQNLGKLDITSRAFTDKMAADAIRRTLAEQIPGLADVNREFSAVRTTRDMLEKHLDATPKFFGPRAKRYMAYLTAGGATGMGLGPLPGMAVAGGAAALETIGSILQSTPMRTWSANRLYRFGKFLEAGELQQAAEVAQQAQAEARAGSGGVGGGDGGGGPQRFPDVGDDILEAEIIDKPSPSSVSIGEEAVLDPNPVRRQSAIPRLSPIEEHAELIAKRDKIISEGVDRSIATGDYNTQLKDVAAQRRQPPPEPAGLIQLPKLGPDPSGDAAVAAAAKRARISTTTTLSEEIPSEYAGRIDPTVRNEMLQSRVGVLGEIASTPAREAVYARLPSGTRVLSMGTEAAVLSSPNGNVIRISKTDRGNPRPNIPEVLQPTSVEKIDKWTVEELPTVEPLKEISAAELQPLQDSIGKRGYRLWDPQPRNIGRTPDGRLVVLDGGAVEPLPKAPSKATVPRLPTPAESLGDRPKAPIATKPAPKPTTSVEAPKLDYSKMSESDLRGELRKAQNVRETYRRMSAGSNQYRKADERVKEIEKALAAGPKRVSANRKGQRIEGVLARSFGTRRGSRALILRADDGSERMVFENEVT